ncbi:MAG: hypothetical protein QM579_01345 [Desulfovibrio sp.]|uniref:hypothetical protein n=1 Tax=Desulfovibrio sp. TaxID=885 RepID=UPI0039E3378A
MVELLEKAIARISYNVFIEYFDDIEELSKVEESQDYLLVLDLFSLLQDGETHNVDFDLVLAPWVKIKMDVAELNGHYRDLIDCVLHKFKADEVKDRFLISSILYNYQKKIIPTLSSAQCREYEEYILKFDKIFLQFKMALLNYGIADIQDDFLGKDDIVHPCNIKYKKIDSKNNSIYLDMNAVHVLANDSNIRRLAEQRKCCFVYSSYLIEDACNSNPIFLNSFCSDLFSITKGGMVGYMDEGLCFVEEKIEDTIARVKKYSELTKKYENSRLLEFVKNYHVHPNLRKGTDLYNKVSKNLIDFFKGEQKSKISGYEEIRSKFNNTCVGGFVNSGSFGVIKDHREAIEELTNLFDFINFETEQVKFSNKKKIASSYRDKCHLEHAYICDYFVTEDKRLQKRATAIYKILGIKTGVIDMKTLKSKLNSNPMEHDQEASLQC